MNTESIYQSIKAAIAAHNIGTWHDVTTGRFVMRRIQAGVGDNSTVFGHELITEQDFDKCLKIWIEANQWRGEFMLIDYPCLDTKHGNRAKIVCRIGKIVDFPVVTIDGHNYQFKSVAAWELYYKVNGTGICVERSQSVNHPYRYLSDCTAERADTIGRLLARS